VRRLLKTALALALVGVATAPVASADSIWVQSYQRVSQADLCPHVTSETPWQSQWGTDSSWHPSYEQWAHGGTGGWTCTRSITWARESSNPAAYIGCIFAGSSPYTTYFEFGSEPFLAAGARVFSDSSCNNAIVNVNTQVAFAYAQSSTIADAVCSHENPSWRGHAFATNLWTCSP
jgi:hypothetical protein